MSWSLQDPYSFTIGKEGKRTYGMEEQQVQRYRGGNKDGDILEATSWSKWQKSRECAGIQDDGAEVVGRNCKIIALGPNLTQRYALLGPQNKKLSIYTEIRFPSSIERKRAAWTLILSYDNGQMEQWPFPLNSP